MTKSAATRATRGPRGLTPVVGAAMASVAAGSLIMFSLLAERVVEPRPGGGVAVTPRVPRDDDADRSLTVPPPPPGDLPPSRVSVLITPIADVVEEPVAVASASEAEIQRRQQTSFTYVGPHVEVARPMGLRGPENRVIVRVGPPDRNDCPGRPQKPRPAGTHPHGGPPACGNPHGAPPGHNGERGNPHGAAPGQSGEHGNPHGAPPGSDNSGATSNPPPTAPPSHSNEGSPPSSSGGNSGPPPSDGPPAGHPHGAPPGQSGQHPHGEPPGQAKNK